MQDEKTYNINEVCEILEISTHTLLKWYDWERLRLKNNEIDSPYLPRPIRKTTERGKPKAWTECMVEELREYKKNIVKGRNGIYGKYTNPLHKEKSVSE